MGGIGLEWWILYALIAVLGVLNVLCTYLTLDDASKYLSAIRNELQDLRRVLEKE